ncbi:hypothetical protein HDU83_004217 [Entophlyctis luteolus]|nr:hypothetical protein HDU83_004217 [Entophlyctis luteolus]
MKRWLTAKLASSSPPSAAPSPPESPKEPQPQTMPLHASQSRSRSAAPSPSGDDDASNPGHPVLTAAASKARKKRGSHTSDASASSLSLSFKSFLMRSVQPSSPARTPPPNNLNDTDCRGSPSPTYNTYNNNTNVSSTSPGSASPVRSYFARVVSSFTSSSLAHPVVQQPHPLHRSSTPPPLFAPPEPPEPSLFANIPDRASLSPRVSILLTQNLNLAHADEQLLEAAVSARLLDLERGSGGVEADLEHLEAMEAGGGDTQNLEKPKPPRKRVSAPPPSRTPLPSNFADSMRRPPSNPVQLSRRASMPAVGVSTTSVTISDILAGSGSQPKGVVSTISNVIRRHSTLAVTNADKEADDVASTFLPSTLRPASKTPEPKATNTVILRNGELGLPLVLEQVEEEEQQLQQSPAEGNVQQISVDHATVEFKDAASDSSTVLLSEETESDTDGVTIHDAPVVDHAKFECLPVTDSPNYASHEEPLVAANANLTIHEADPFVLAKLNGESSSSNKDSMFLNTRSSLIDSSGKGLSKVGNLTDSTDGEPVVNSANDCADGHTGAPAESEKITYEPIDSLMSKSTQSFVSVEEFSSSNLPSSSEGEQREEGAIHVIHTQADEVVKVIVDDIIRSACVAESVATASKSVDEALIGSVPHFEELPPAKFVTSERQDGAHDNQDDARTVFGSGVNLSTSLETSTPSNQQEILDRVSVETKSDQLAQALESLKTRLTYRPVVAMSEKEKLANYVLDLARPIFFSPASPPVSPVSSTSSQTVLTTSIIPRKSNPVVQLPPQSVRLSRTEFEVVTVCCRLPRHLSYALHKKICSMSPETTKSGTVGWNEFESFIEGLYQHWNPDVEALAFEILRGSAGKERYILPEDFRVFVEDVLETNSAFAFLASSPDFQARFTETVIVRLFYTSHFHGRNRMSLRDFRTAKIYKIIADIESATNSLGLNIPAPFSYKDFYVIYCAFWELDKDHDMYLTLHDLERYSDHGISHAALARVIECYGKVPVLPGTAGGDNDGVSENEKRGGSGGSAGGVSDMGSPSTVAMLAKNKIKCFGFKEFVSFIMAVEDKTSVSGLHYWFRVLDIDEDGLVSLLEIETFWEHQYTKVPEQYTVYDFFSLIIDLIRPETNSLTLLDLKRNAKAAGLFLDFLLDSRRHMENIRRSADVTFRLNDEVWVTEEDDEDVLASPANSASAVETAASVSGDSDATKLEGDVAASSAIGNGAAGNGEILPKRIKLEGWQKFAERRYRLLSGTSTDDEGDDEM